MSNLQRQDGDSWSITESVGATALAVAIARAQETESENPLITDPYARMLISEVDGKWAKVVSGEMAEEMEKAGIDYADISKMMNGYIACRTLWFDEFCLSNTKKGIDQVVILASGLDARAYRLEWPQGTKVFEIDQPLVLEYKAKVMEKNNIKPTSDRVPLAVDLRNDWRTPLLDAGFDPRKPSIWLAEGLLPYLPSSAQDSLFDTIAELSAKGSALAMEAISTESIKKIVDDQSGRYKLLMDQSKDQELDVNIEGLWYLEDRNDPQEYFAKKDWTSTNITSSELLKKHDRSPESEKMNAVPDSDFIIVNY